MGGKPTIVVIGAGPYGLATAAHLGRLGRPVRVFGGVMDSWHSRMPAGMYLKSTPQASSLSAPEPGNGLEDFCRIEGVEPFDDFHPIPVEDFVRYGEWFQRRLVPEVENAKVVRVDPLPKGSGGMFPRFLVVLDSGEEVAASAVVVASGLVGAAHVPRLLLELAEKEPEVTGPVSHASQHADFAAFAGRRVAVVGAGQSALESAALLREQGAEVTLLVRGQRVVWGGPPAPGRSVARRMAQPDSPLGEGWSHVAVSRLPLQFRRLPAATRLWVVKQVLGPFGSWWLKDRVDGQVPIATGRRIKSAQLSGGEVVLSLETPVAAATRSAAAGPHDRTLVVDHVLAATGYRPDVDRLDWLAPELRHQVRRVPGSASPDLDPWFRSSVAGLRFTGLAAAPTFGPLMRFVAGTDFAAPRLAAGLS
ncbi:FAD-dependent oxidoreductase [Streptacidiphilus carbonis]|uniref:FAD-dependent oxidoreductase n=1 Tax=Streptacidiphilus carbonis TaxID=105422 RepID=UPI0005A6662F|nr:FAD-dependent oxidoreductase [Streptacidiphilus carbonis]